MSKLISGKEALIALANGEEVENWNGSVWWDVDKTWEVGAFMADRKFRLKPKTITINGIEVPKPFKAEEYEDCYMLTDLYNHGYTKTSWKYCRSVPTWRTEEEIKQVVVALRSIFRGE